MAAACSCWDGVVSADIRNELARTQLPFGVKAGCPMEDWMAERKKGAREEVL
jgi:hypothetical protein